MARENKFPAYAILGTIGKVHVVEYDLIYKKFWVIDSHDNRRLASRDELRFIKGKKNARS